jgi:hypothetical protein
MEPAKLCVVNLKGEDKNEKKKLAYTSWLKSWVKQSMKLV